MRIADHDSDPCGRRVWSVNTARFCGSFAIDPRIARSTDTLVCTWFMNTSVLHCTRSAGGKNYWALHESSERRKLEKVVFWPAFWRRGESLFAWTWLFRRHENQQFIRSQQNPVTLKHWVSAFFSEFLELEGETYTNRKLSLPCVSH